MQILSKKPTERSLGKPKEISAIDALHEAIMHGVDMGSLVDSMQQYFASTEAPSTQPLLPLFFRLRGKPYTLDKHYQFEPLFRTNMPDEMTTIAGRQTGKSQQLASSTVLRALTLPGFRQMYVTPYFDQIRRFSHNYVRPLIEHCNYRGMLVKSGLQQNVLERTLPNGASMLFGYASRDIGSLRGASVDAIGFDEIQGFDPTLLPLIKEASSASDWNLCWYSGTALSLNTPDQLMLSQSSQAEWIIPCLNPMCSTNGLHTWNEPLISRHGFKMIGKAHDDVSHQTPGIVCHKCRKPISTWHGHWQHSFKERVQYHPGYRVPQIVMPDRCEDPRKWRAIWTKFLNRQSYGTNRFANEVMGEASDTGNRLISDRDLKRAAVLDLKNNPTYFSERLIQQARQYPFLALGIDWGGGGTLEESWTAVALLGYMPGLRLDLLWGRKLYTPNEHHREAEAIIRICKQFEPHIIAHDFSGKGDMREEMLIEAGIPERTLMGMQYVQAGQRSICKYIPATRLQPRAHYQVDKSRSLQWVTDAIKYGRIHTFQYDYVTKDDPGLLTDFTHLVEVNSPTRSGKELYKIIRERGFSDDFAQAVNYGCVGICHMNNWWPHLYNPKAYGTDFEEDWTEADVLAL